ncbi:helix-turn-helix transcriptional regulator [Longispora albida]|uniref:helix-turn-helix transcriptional regulator n=1 Tax=Longispora albida TaxID=203523 RepID=UPI0003689FC8|nr:helix-turn-helix transcriptional regulator [Longispora albida]
MADMDGASLRRAREEAGLSLAGMARRAGYSRSHLGNVETGAKRVTTDVVLAYERVLGDVLDRRGVLTGLAAGLIGPGAASELIRHGFTSALDGRGSPDDWERQVAGYGHDYMVLGASELQAKLAGDLVVLQQHVESPHLWGLAARAMTVYGKTTKEPAEAISWYALAGKAADRSGDESVQVWTRGRAALALAYEGAALNVASQLAEHALQLSDKPSLGRLNALLGQAHVQGLRGQRKEAQSSLDTARRVFDQCGSEEQISDFAIPEWRMATISSLLLSRVGAEAQAVKAQETADTTRPATLPRFATHIELHRGLMLARTGDRTGGATYARAALAKLPAEKHSQSLRLMLTEIERTGS